MTPYFADAGMSLALIREAKQWLGTPFSPNGRTPGPRGGVSCHTLAHALYLSVGAIPAGTSCPVVSMRRSQFIGDSMVEPYVSGVSQLREIDVDSAELMVGDLLAFRIGKAAHHLGVVLDPPHFIHAMYRLGTGVSDLRDATWRSRWTKTWRPTV